MNFVVLLFYYFVVFTWMATFLFGLYLVLFDFPKENDGYMPNDDVPSYVEENDVPSSPPKKDAVWICREC